MTKRPAWIAAGAFFLAFLLLTPLGRFSDRIPPERHTGYYSLTDIDISDEGGHYVFLTSLWFDHDLDFSNNWKMNVQAFSSTVTGVARNYWTIGPALLWAPFFAAGRLVTRWLAAHGHAMDPDGYDFPELAFTGLGTIVCAYLGVLCLTHVLRRFTTERAAPWIALAAFFASLTPFYTFIQTKMAHGPEFALNAGLLLAAFRAAEAPDARNRWLALGVLSGFASIIRLNAPMTLVYVLPLFWRRLFPAGFRRAWPAIPDWKRLGNAFAPWAAAFVPLHATQALAAWTFFGKPFGSTGDPSYSTDSVLSPEGFARLANLPALWEILAGPQYGIVWMMPLVVPGIRGLWNLACSREQDAPMLLARAGLVHAGLLLAMILMFRHWGNGFGYRYLAAAVPALAVGLSVFHARVAVPRGWGRPFTVGATLAVFWQYAQILQHKTWLAHDDPEHTWQAFMNLPDLLSPLSNLLRASAWLPVALRDGLVPENAREWFFLAGLPLVLAGFLAAVAFLWNRMTARPEAVDRITPWGTAAILAAIIPVLAIGLFPPRKTEDRLYASLVSKIRACRAAPPIYRHPHDEILPRAWRLGRALERDQPDIDLLYAELLVRTGRREEAASLLETLVARHPECAGAARCILPVPEPEGK